MSDIKISQMEPWVGAVTGNVEIPAVYANQNYRIALSQISTSTFGFGSMALQNSNAVNITGGNVAVTALSGAITIANGGTGLGTTPTNGQLLIGNGTGYTLAGLTAGAGISIANSSGGITISATNVGAGTVTSVGVDGQSTGLYFTNSPITTSGTIVMGGILNVTNGGTGAANASGARANLGAAASGANSDITSLSGLTTPLSVDQGGTGATGISGYVYGNGSMPFSSVAAIPVSDLTGTLPLSQGGTGATTAAAARAAILPNYLGKNGQALFVNSTATDVEWNVVYGAGTVTSVNISGGSSGLTATGGPIVAAGTITLGGTLNTSAGGTGISSYTAGDITYYASGTALSKLSLGAANYMLTSSGSAPEWSDPATVTVGSATSAVSATTATNIAGGAAGSIPYQTASGATSLLAAGSGVLVGGSTPAYSTTPSLTGTNFTAIPNAALVNSGVTIGTTSVSLGATALTLGGLTSVTVTQDPVSNLDLATKQYVDTLIAAGIHYHAPVKYEVPDTTGNLNAIYDNGVAGVGATLTNNGTLAAFAPDGPTAQIGDRILIYNQTNQFENGIYEVSVVGSGSVAWVLTRTADADSFGAGPTGLGEGSAFFITSGNTGAGETYVCSTPGTITFGVTAISFAQISSAQVYSAGTGLTLTGTTFSITAPVTVALGGTGQTTYTDGQLLIGKTDGSLAKTTLTAGSGVSVTNGDGSITIANTAPDQVVAITGGTGISTSGTYPNFTVTNAAPDQVVSLTSGTGISATGTYPNFTIANTAPDQVVSITGGTNISVTGTYPNFTVSASGGGTVTSVSGTGTVNGITLTGTVTSSGSLTLGGTLSGIDLTTQITGTLPVANGGTGATALTANAVLLGNGTSALQSVAPGTSGNVLTSNGTTWVSQAPAPAGLTQAKATVLSMILGL